MQLLRIGLKKAAEILARDTTFASHLSRMFGLRFPNLVASPACDCFLVVSRSLFMAFLPLFRKQTDLCQGMDAREVVDRSRQNE